MSGTAYEITLFSELKMGDVASGGVRW